MANIPRNRLKQGPLDKWSLREKLALACGVMRSGDLNWVSVNRAVKAFAEPGRPPEWFSQKNCAMQYSDLLDKVETPKRKRGERDVREAPVDVLVRKLTIERIEELKSVIQEQQLRYKKLKREVELVSSGQADEKLKEIWAEIQKRKAAEAKPTVSATPSTPTQGLQAPAQKTKRPSPGLKIDISAALGGSDPDAVDQDSFLQDTASQDSSVSQDAVEVSEEPVECEMSPVVTVTDEPGESGEVSEPGRVQLSSLLQDQAALSQALQAQEEKTRKLMAEVQSQGGTSLVNVGDREEQVMVKTEPSESHDIHTPDIEVKEEVVCEEAVPIEVKVEEVTVSEAEVVVSEEVITSVASHSKEEQEAAGEEEEEQHDQVSPESMVATPLGDDDSRLEQDVAGSPEQSIDTPLTVSGRATGELMDTDAPVSPASSVMSNETDGGSGRGKGRRSRGGKLCHRGRRSARSSRQRLMYNERKESETSSKPSEAESSEEEEEPLLLGNEADDSLAASVKQALGGLESLPNSPASLTLGSDTEDEKAHKVWKKSIMLVWNAAAHHKYANAFRHPVSEDIAPGYHSVVSRPMDLSTVKKNVECGLIRTTGDFQRDMMLMFTNAIMYNNSDHDVFHMATDMYNDVMAHIEQFVNTEMMVHTEPKVLRASRRHDTSQSDKEEDPKKKRLSTATSTPTSGDVDPHYSGGKAKKRRQ